MKRKILATLAAGAALAVSAVPAQAVHAGQTFCSSRNSVSGVRFEMTNLDTAGGLYPSTYQIRPGTCVDVASRDAYRLRLHTFGAYCMRVGYNFGPYRAWQYDPDGVRDFRPADHDTIYFDLRSTYACD
jgi:hypothetical protein